MITQEGVQMAIKMLWQKKKTPILLGLVLLAALAVGAIFVFSNRENENANEPITAVADDSNTEPCEPTQHVEAALVDAPTDEPQNNVLQIVTGHAQWEGIVVYTYGEGSLNLQPDREYEFAFRIYTPTEHVGIVFQANTHNGWSWDVVSIKSPEELQPTGWHEMRGTINFARDDVAGLPRLVLVRNFVPDNPDFDEIVTFWIDDFTVTDVETGEIVFFDDFEGRTTAMPFRGSGGTPRIVPEYVIYYVPEPTQLRGQHALDVPSLAEIWQNYFLIGNIINPWDFGRSATARERYAVLKHHFNAITFENFMKPDSMWGPGNAFRRPPITNAQARLAELDGFVSRLIDDGFKVIGHTLVWHGQSSNWLNLASGNRTVREGPNAAVYLPHAQARENMELFINTIAGHYYNHPDGLYIYSWDVINEAIRRQEPYPIDAYHWGHHTIGAIWPATWNSPWFESYRTDAAPGVNPWDYVYDAFVFARHADPSTVLYYNDFNMEVPEKVRMVVYMVNAVNLMWAQDEINNPLHGNAAFTCVQDYITAGGRLLIEGIGMQQHDHINNRSHQRTSDAIQAFASTGARVSITELDVGVGGYTGECTHLSEFDELRQAIYYARLFLVFKENAEHIHRVSFWGLCDGRNWRRSELPLLFDPYLRTKLAFYAVADPVGFLEERGNPHLVLP